MKTFRIFQLIIEGSLAIGILVVSGLELDPSFTSCIVVANEKLSVICQLAKPELWISALLTGLLVISQIGFSSYSDNELLHKSISRAMEGLKAKHFKEMSGYRLTVFMEGTKWQCFKANVKRRFSILRGKREMHKKYTFQALEGTHIFPFHREGEPNDHEAAKSKTYFYVHHVSEDLCEGIAGIAFRSWQIVESGKLPNIGRALKDYRRDPKYLPTDSERALRTYMENSYMSDVNQVGRLSRPRRFYFGYPVSNIYEKQVASFVFGGDSQPPEEVKEAVKRFCKTELKLLLS